MSGGHVLKLGDVVPNFKADTTQGEIDFHTWLGGSWGVLFSHPADYTPVCTTELGRVQMLNKEFCDRGVKLIALSCDTTESHHGWIKDILAYNKLTEFSYPIIADPSRDVATLYGMMDPDEKDSAGLPLTCRAVFIIGPDKTLKLSILYPATTGRNFDEILRVVDSLQLTATRKVATPVDWKNGGSCMVVPSVKQDDVGALFPKGVTVHEVPSGKVYLRTTPQPE
uniref:1-Cys peroxiredoxin n=1 Tax=Pseudodiaptomus poplesia TaxID=213370 RepID=A0A0U2TH86_9MAXI|nr:peroxiredoxin 6 [Pseudodiaptomus poplesia]